jgi:hypothetical protein
MQALLDGRMDRIQQLLKSFEETGEKEIEEIQPPTQQERH